MTWEGVRRILELREILLSFQTGFNIVNAAVVCAILEIISGLEPLLVITDEGSKLKILSRIAQAAAALTMLKPVWNDRSIYLSS